MSSPIYTFAHIFGGTTVLDNPDELHTYACQMINYAEQLEMNTSAMQQTHSYIHQRSMTIATCAAHSGASHPSSAHCANLCTVLAQHVQSALSVIAQLRHIADCMMRSYNLYSQTEAQTSRIISALTMAAAYHYPVPTAFALGAWSTIREMTSPHASLIGALTNSRSAQEDYLSGVSRIFSPCEGIPGVADALAHPVSPLSSTHTSYAMNIKAVSVSAPLPAAHNLHDTIVNLEKLSIGQPGNSYGTVAIQRYMHTDGSHSWIVTIPGTDGKKDSPFGWSQNLSLMSSREQTREQAHSLLAVRTAMHRAGIKAGEPVALVGHSQGGNCGCCFSKRCTAALYDCSCCNRRLSYCASPYCHKNNVGDQHRNRSRNRFASRWTQQSKTSSLAYCARRYQRFCVRISKQRDRTKPRTCTLHLPIAHARRSRR